MDAGQSADDGLDDDEVADLAVDDLLQTQAPQRPEARSPSRYR